MVGLLSVSALLLVVMPALLYMLGYAVHHYGSGKPRAHAAVRVAGPGAASPLASPAQTAKS